MRSFLNGGWNRNRTYIVPYVPNSLSGGISSVIVYSYSTIKYKLNNLHLARTDRLRICTDAYIHSKFCNSPTKFRSLTYINLYKNAKEIITSLQVVALKSLGFSGYLVRKFL